MTQRSRRNHLRWNETASGQAVAAIISTVLVAGSVAAVAYATEQNKHFGDGAARDALRDHHADRFLAEATLPVTGALVHEEGGLDGALFLDRSHSRTSEEVMTSQSTSNFMEFALLNGFLPADDGGADDELERLKRAYEDATGLGSIGYQLSVEPALQDLSQLQLDGVQAAYIGQVTDEDLQQDSQARQTYDDVRIYGRSQAMGSPAEHLWRTAEEEGATDQSPYQDDVVEKIVEEGVAGAEGFVHEKRRYAEALTGTETDQDYVDDNVDDESLTEQENPQWVSRSSNIREAIYLEALLPNFIAQPYQVDDYIVREAGINTGQADDAAATAATAAGKVNEQKDEALEEANPFQTLDEDDETPAETGQAQFGHVVQEFRAGAITALIQNMDQFDTIIIGSGVDHDLFDREDMQFALETWIKREGGMLIVLASEEAPNEWLRYLVPDLDPIAKAGYGADGVAHHHNGFKRQLANSQAQPNWARHAYDWSNVPDFVQEKFRHLATDEAGNPVLSISRPGELGYRGGVVFSGLDTGDPRFIGELMKLHTMGLYKGGQFGYHLPDDTSISTALKLTTIRDTFVPNLPAQLTLHLWIGANTQTIQDPDSDDYQDNEVAEEHDNDYDTTCGEEQGLLPQADVEDETCQALGDNAERSMTCYNHADIPMVYTGSYLCRPEIEPGDLDKLDDSALTIVNGAIWAAESFARQQNPVYFEWDGVGCSAYGSDVQSSGNTDNGNGEHGAGIGSYDSSAGLSCGFGIYGKASVRGYAGHAANTTGNATGQEMENFVIDLDNTIEWADSQAQEKADQATGAANQAGDMAQDKVADAGKTVQIPTSNLNTVNTPTAGGKLVMQDANGKFIWG